MRKMTRNQGFICALRNGEKKFAERNPVQSARGFVAAYKSNIKFYKELGWDTGQDEENLRIAKRKLREVLASGSKDIDYDKGGNLI